MQINAAIDRFWRALTHPHFPNAHVVNFGSYKQLHLRISKVGAPQRWSGPSCLGQSMFTAWTVAEDIDGRCTAPKR